MKTDISRSVTVGYLYPWVISDWQQVPTGKLQCNYYEFHSMQTALSLWVTGIKMAARPCQGEQRSSESLSRITRWGTKLKFYVGWELGVLFALASVWPDFTSDLNVLSSPPNWVTTTAISEYGNHAGYCVNKIRFVQQINHFEFEVLKPTVVIVRETWRYVNIKCDNCKKIIDV